MVKYAILGPVELRSGERLLSAGGPRQLRLLAFLLLHPNRAVSTDQMVDALWDGQVTPGALKRVRMAVARLRETLEVCGSDTRQGLRTVAGGYLLDVGPGELDADVFAAQLAEGRRALDRGEAAQAAELLHAALGLWRGPALAELSYEEFAQAEIRRLEELRLTALESRIEAELRLGRHAAIVGELESLTLSHPTRERLAAQLMLALYRCGRQAEALDVYGRTRAHLSANLGLEPGPELRALQEGVLVQSPSLALSVDAAAPPQTRRREPGAMGLPARPVELLGRAGDTRALTELLHRHDVRLVTIMGAGGVGKTTLAVEVAHELFTGFADGVAFVDLAALSDPGAVADAVLRGLGRGPEPGATALRTLCGVVAAREQLLVLDNFEHLVSAAPRLAELIASAPRLKLLVTSRVALELRAEHCYRLDPLGLPSSGDPAAVAAAPASSLFLVRAIARNPAARLTEDNAGAIATICARVGGLPLAIELAAAHAATLSAQEIAVRLDRALPMLASGGRDLPDRQRTLRATLDWSYRLLGDDQRAAFAELSVFAGGCTIDAAERVTGATLDVLESLIDHSLLTRRASGDGTSRLAMLEPVREYAAERLAAQPGGKAVFERHSRYYIDLAEIAAPRLLSGEQLAWQRRLDAEADNFREALEREHRAGEAQRVLRLATALREWWRRGRGPAGRAWVERGLTGGGESPAALRADALTTVCLLAAQQGDIAYALERAHTALELYEQADHRRGKAVVLVGVTVCHLLLGDAEAAARAAGDAVQSADGLDAWSLGYALIAQALAAPDPVAARPIAERSAALLRQAGDTRAQAWLYGDLGYRALEHEALDDARELIERSLKLSEQLDDQVHHSFDVCHMALWALQTGDHVGAAAGLSDALARYSRYGLRRPTPEALIGVALIAADAGDAGDAAELLGAARTLRGDEPFGSMEERLYSRALKRSQHDADIGAWERAFAAGCRRTLEDAVALARETADRLSADVVHAARQVV